MLAVSLPFCSVSLINECENLITLTISLIPQEAAHVPCGGCTRKKQQGWSPGRTAWGPQVRWESEGKCAQLLCSVSLGPRRACGIHSLVLPSRVRPLPTRADGIGPHLLAGVPIPPPRALAALSSVSELQPFVSPGRSPAVPAVTPAGTPSRGHTQPLGQSSRCRAPRISPDFSPYLCVYEYWETPLK